MERFIARIAGRKREMKRITLLTLLFMVTLTAFAESAGKEFRGIWLRPPKNPAEIPVMLDHIANGGFNAVFVETFYHGFTISATSPIPTRPEFAGKDILKTFVEEGHRRQLQIHAWVEAFYWEVDTTEYPQFPKSPLLYEHPEWALKLKGGRETWEAEYAHRFANPAHPGVRTLLVSFCQDLLTRYAIDGLHLDYIRYPGGEDDAGYDSFTLGKFREEMGYDPSELAPADATQWKPWVEWRENQVTETVRQIRKMQKETRPDALLSAAVFPDYYSTRYERHFIFQDSSTWAKEGIVDAVLPMAYGETLAWIRRAVTEAKKYFPAPAQLMPGLAVERLHKDRYSTSAHPPVGDQIELVRQLGCPGHAFYCYEWVLDSVGGFQAFREGPYRDAFPDLKKAKEPASASAEKP